MVKISRKIKILWALSITIFLFAIAKTIGAVYATGESVVPTIDIRDQNQASIGAIFDKNKIWYPGDSETAKLRVQNNRGTRVKVTKVGANAVLTKDNAVLNMIDSTAQDYLKSMKVIIKYENPIKNFLNGEVFSGDFDGLIKNKTVSIPLEDKDYVDLIYTVTFDRNIGDSVQGVTAKVDFTVNVEEEPTYSYGSGSSYTPPPADNKPPSDNDDDKEEPDNTPPEIKDHWAKDSIIALLKAGVISGYPDGTIKPDNNITRAEAAVLVGKALKLEPRDKFFSGYFDRLPTWARGYIIVTSEKGIFHGYSGRLFKPGKFINREEMATVLVRSFHKKLVSNKQLDFKDKDKISKWAEYYVKVGTQNKIIEGYPDNTFRPKNSITRAEVFNMLYKLLGYDKEKK